MLTSEVKMPKSTPVLRKTSADICTKIGHSTSNDSIIFIFSGEREREWLDGIGCSSLACLLTCTCREIERCLSFLSRGEPGRDASSREWRCTFLPSRPNSFPRARSLARLRKAFSAHFPGVMEHKRPSHRRKSRRKRH